MLRDSIAREIGRRGVTDFEIVVLDKEDPDVISHHGIPGMKWGVRRTKAQLASAKAAKKTAKKDKKAGTSQGKLRKKAQSMSDDELKDRIKRLELEKKYVTLTKEANAQSKTRIDRGKEEMANIAKASAKQAATKHGTNIATQALTYSIKKANKDYTPPKK